MYKKHKYDIIIILALIGFAVSGFLSLSKITGVPVPCAVSGGCDAVLSSRYSALFGIPLSFYGMAYFVALIASGLLANHYPSFRKGLSWLSAAGALFAAGLISIQLFAIGRLCQYCLVTDFLAIGIFLWDLNIELSEEKTS